MSDPTTRDSPVGVDFFRIENGPTYVDGEIDFLAEMMRAAVKDDQFGPFGSLLPMQKNNQKGRGLYHCARPPACSFCLTGISNADLVADQVIGSTCGEIVSYAKMIPGSWPGCQSIKSLEPACCVP